ncbi:MAG: hypothetical protein WKF84_12340 [Pyrinomonadaceae bacterium]
MGSKGKQCPVAVIAQVRALTIQRATVDPAERRAAVESRCIKRIKGATPAML